MAGATYIPPVVLAPSASRPWAEPRSMASVCSISARAVSMD